MQRKAYSYMRFSSHKQADGDSLRRQTDDRDDICRRKKLDLDTTLNLADLAVSAWKGDNADTGALSVFLDLCKKGVIEKGSCLIVEHLDRLTRQHVRKALTLFFEILDAGVTIITVQPEREYTPESSNDPLSLIEPLFLFAAANEKSETLSKRLREAWAEKRRKRSPMTRWTPAWIRMKDDRSGYELIPEKAQIVRDIVNLYLSGYGDLRLLRKLNDDKVPVISGHRCWTNAYIAKILRTPALIGDYAPCREVEGKHIPTGELWEGHFPAVITKDEWYRLRASRRSHTRKRGPVGKEVANLFTGLLYNARDGELYHRIQKDIPRLVSAAYRNGMTGGDTLSLSYEPLEQAFLYGLAHDLKLHDLYGGSQTTDEPDKVEGLTAKLAEVEHKLETLKKRVEEMPEVTAFLDLLAVLDAKQKSLKAEIEQEKARKSETGVEVEALNDLQAWANLWAEEGSDRTHLRTKLRTKIRMLIKEMRMIVYGEQKSKFKTAQVQIFFKAGGSVVLCLSVERTKLLSAELLHWGSGAERGDAVKPFCDFRLLNDPEKGQEVREYVALMEKVHAHSVQQRLKYPEKSEAQPEPVESNG